MKMSALDMTHLKKKLKCAGKINNRSIKALERKASSALFSPKCADFPNCISIKQIIHLSSRTCPRLHFFPRISYPMNIKSVFLVVEAGKAEDVVNLMLQILSSLIAYKEILQDTGWYPVFPVVNFAVQGVGTLPVRRVDCLLFRWFLLLLMVCLHS